MAVLTLLIMTSYFINWDAVPYWPVTSLTRTLIGPGYDDISVNEQPEGQTNKMSQLHRKFTTSFVTRTLNIQDFKKLISFCGHVQCRVNTERFCVFPISSINHSEFRNITLLKHCHCISSEIQLSASANTHRVEPFGYAGWVVEEKTPSQGTSDELTCFGQTMIQKLDLLNTCLEYNEYQLIANIPMTEHFYRGR